MELKHKNWLITMESHAKQSEIDSLKSIFWTHETEVQISFRTDGYTIDTPFFFDNPNEKINKKEKGGIDHEVQISNNLQKMTESELMCWTLIIGFTEVYILND